jgi:uncharacterized protein YndB with AHSA1/START domain
MTMVQGSASTVINRPVSEVFDAVSDVTRMGEWSPECAGGRWIAPATGPAVSAKFEGDNIVKVGPITLKRWTTTSEITDYVPNELFGFVVEGYTTWQYELKDHAGATSITESFSHQPHEGWKKFVYDTVARRSNALARGMQQTLTRMKETLEH